MHAGKGVVVVVVEGVDDGRQVRFLLDVLVWVELQVLVEGLLEGEVILSKYVLHS